MVLNKLDFFYIFFFMSGHILLERYGMTEIGMALSNPLHGPRLPVRLICNIFLFWGLAAKKLATKDTVVWSNLFPK